jgi:GNAT superfamily N-acetyltransferase
VSPDRKITIRKAVAADAPLIYQLIKELAEFERISHEVVATEEIVRDSLFGAAPAAEAILAECDGSPAGFAIVFENFSTFVGRPGLYIEDLYVRPEYRGAGIGKALFTRCAAIARERNLGRMEWAVLDWNPAREFYERFGARALDDWIIYRLTEGELGKLAGS